MLGRAVIGIGVGVAGFEVRLRDGRAGVGVARGDLAAGGYPVFIDAVLEESGRLQGGEPRRVAGNFGGQEASRVLPKPRDVFGLLVGPA